MSIGNWRSLCTQFVVYSQIDQSNNIVIHLKRKEDKCKFACFNNVLLIFFSNSLPLVQRPQQLFLTFLFVTWVQGCGNLNAVNETANFTILVTYNFTFLLHQRFNWNVGILCCRHAHGAVCACQSHAHTMHIQSTYRTHQTHMQGSLNAHTTLMCMGSALCQPWHMLADIQPLPKK